MTIVQPPFNKNRTEIIRKYSKLYLTYFDGSYREWICKKFGNCKLNEIKKENMHQYITWAYFLKHDDRTKSKLNLREIEWREDFVTTYLFELEHEINYKFKDGYNDKIKPILPMHEKQKMKICYHPLFMYLSIWLFLKQTANIIFSFYCKFKYKYINGLKVWYRLNNKSKKKINEIEPLLMFGGVSAGNPLQCVVFINELIKKFKENKPLFVIEIPWSEMSINHFMPYSGYLVNKLPLTMMEVTDILFEIENMILIHNEILFDKNGHEKRLKLQWNLVGESFGTFMCSAIYQEIKMKQYGIIPRLILIDAPTLCMTDPTANRLQSIVEKDLDKRLFQLLVGQEIMIATMGTRYFHWMEYCIYPHDLINDGLNGKSHIVISGTDDHVIPFKTIKKGIIEANKLCKGGDNKEIIHIIMDGIQHGIFLLHTKYQQTLIDLL